MFPRVQMKTNVTFDPIFEHKYGLRGFEKGCQIVGGHMANDMLFDDFLTLPTFRNLVFLRPARVN